MIKQISLLALSVMLLTACSKTVIDVAPQTSVNKDVQLSDPENCPPTTYQSNTNAFQYNFARMKLLKGMTGSLSRTSTEVINNYRWLVYLRAENGKYYLIPGKSFSNINYNFTIGAATSAVNPKPLISITRGTGIEEIFETIIVIGVKPAYLSGISPAMDLTNYEAVKTKLGF